MSAPCPFWSRIWKGILHLSYFHGLAVLKCGEPGPMASSWSRWGINHVKTQECWFPTALFYLTTTTQPRSALQRQCTCQHPPAPVTSVSIRALPGRASASHHNVRCQRRRRPSLTAGSRGPRTSGSLKHETFILSTSKHLQAAYATGSCWSSSIAKVRNHKKSLERTFSSFELLENQSEDSNRCQTLLCHHRSLSWST